ncbi:GNAT family N-acetyltransferase [Streptomyces sp. NPDC091292]|uniref:GNAT family N-acetyltransferase n=1 Tax=Streptomyces sp. NPDC091292 TaxID=3365991 RepID=UPI0038060ECB
MPSLIPDVLPPGTFAGREQPVLPVASGLRVRPWEPKDAPAVFAAFQDPLMHQWHARAADSEDEVRGWIEEWRTSWTGERHAFWAVADAESDEIAGRVALRCVALEDGAAEIAYWTVPAARGRGVAPIAVTALSRWALHDIGFHRIELLHATGNEASCRVADKTGFALEGTKRSALLHQDGWHDMHLHARVRADAAPPPGYGESMPG